MEPIPSRPELQALLEDARRRYDALSPEDRAAHDRAARESFARGMLPLPSKYQRGERIIRDGQVLEFIEEEIEGEKWRVIGPASEKG